MGNGAEQVKNPARAHKTYRNWTKTELDWLTSNAEQYTPDEAAAHLDRPLSSIENKGVVLKLKFKKRQRVLYGKVAEQVPWSDEDIAKLREYAGKMPVKELAAKLGRTYVATYVKAREIGLNASFSRKRWTQEEYKKLLECEHLTIAELADSLGRSRQVTANKLRERGYKFLCGVYSLKGASKHTGYNMDQLQRARKALKQKWRRVKSFGTHMRYKISEEQLEEICEWLKNDTWKRGAARSLSE